jgi:hypothetical protein
MDRYRRQPLGDIGSGSIPSAGSSDFTKGLKCNSTVLQAEAANGIGNKPSRLQRLVQLLPVQRKHVRRGGREVGARVWVVPSEPRHLVGQPPKGLLHTTVSCACA